MPRNRNPPRTEEEIADGNRRDAEWLRQQMMSLSNYAILVNGITVSEMRAALFAIHSGRPWR